MKRSAEHNSVQTYITHTRMAMWLIFWQEHWGDAMEKRIVPPPPRQQMILKQLNICGENWVPHNKVIQGDGTRI